MMDQIRQNGFQIHVKVDEDVVISGFATNGALFACALVGHPSLFYTLVCVFVVVPCTVIAVVDKSGGCGSAPDYCSHITVPFVLWVLN